MKEKNSIIVLPSYQPDEKLIKVVNELFINRFKVLVINDGSDPSYDKIFDQIKDKAIVIGYQGNKGKGFALKHGYKYIYEHLYEYPYLITADGDGQHATEDIIKMDEIVTSLKRPVIGVRDFKTKVPIKSRIGNNLSCLTQTLITSRYLRDNQCGLRAFTREDIPWMMKVKGNRYEYEMNIISYLQLKEMKYAPMHIQTIYENNNEGSHFRPFRDTVRIQKIILKFGLPKLISFIIGIVLSYIYFQFAFSNINLNYEVSTLLAALTSFLFYLLIYFIIYRPLIPYRPLLRNVVIKMLSFIGVFLFVELFSRLLNLPIALSYFLASFVMIFPSHYLLKAMAMVYESQI